MAFASANLEITHRLRAARSQNMIAKRARESLGGRPMSSVVFRVSWTLVYIFQARSLFRKSSGRLSTVLIQVQKRPHCIAGASTSRGAGRFQRVKYAWSDGKELLFDQSYLHSAINQTEISRIILFCDVEKTQLIPGIKQLADAVDYALVAKFTGADDAGKLSWISRTYKPIYSLRSYVKEKIKPRSLLAYNIIKYGTIVLVICLLYYTFHFASKLI